MATSPSKSSRKGFAVFLTLVALGGVSAVAFILALKPPIEGSDPTAVRPWTTRYDDMLGSVRAMPPAVAPITHPPLGSFSRTNKPGAVRFHCDQIEEPNWYHQPMPATFLTADKSLPLAGGRRAKIFAIGVSYPTDVSQRTFSLFDPVTLEPMEVADLPQFALSNASRALVPHKDSRHAAPEIFVAWDMRKADRLMIQNENFFDSRTHDHFNSYYHFVRFYPNMKVSGMSINRWHDAPFILSVDFMDPEAESASFQPEAGTTLTLPKSKLDLQVNQVETIITPHPGHSGGRDNHGHHEVQYIELRTDPKQKGETTLIFLSLIPPRDKANITFKALMKDGKSRYLNSYTFDDFRKILRLDVPLEELQEIQVQVSHPRERAAFTFSRLPGLPPENDGLTNLFDTHIPYLDMENTSIQSILERHGQVRFSSSIGTLYRGAATRYYDVTLDELFREYQTSVPDVRLNPATFEVEPRTSIWDTWKKRLGGLWPF